MSLPPSPRLTCPPSAPLEPGREKSVQVRGPGSPPPSGIPRFSAEAGAGGMRNGGGQGKGGWGDVVDQAPLPRIHLGSGEALGEDGEPGFR